MGYFYKIYICDHFVFLDDVAYSKGSLTARTYCRKQPGRSEKSYLTVPLRKAPLGTPIGALDIDHTQDWPRQHLNRIANLYHKAPFFESYFPEMEQWMAAAPAFTKLADWNRFGIEAMNRLLGLTAPSTLASEVPLSANSTDYLIQLIVHLQGDRYLSGRGGEKYQDTSSFEQAGITLSYHDLFGYLERHPYPQEQGPWLNGLSALDALMNIGAAGILELFRQYTSANLL